MKWPLLLLLLGLELTLSVSMQKEKLVSLERTSIHKSVNEECTELYVVCDKTEEVGVYDVKYNGYNKFTILDTDYDDYIIIHLRNIKIGETFQLMTLYGWKTKLSSKIKKTFGDLCKKQGIFKENILDLTEPVLSGDS